MKKNIENICVDPTQEYALQIPCILAERVEAYATENKTTLPSVVIEALDSFLRDALKR